MTDTTTDELRRLARALGFVNFDDDAEEIVRLALEHAASWKARAEKAEADLDHAQRYANLLALNNGPPK